MSRNGEVELGMIQHGTLTQLKLESVLLQRIIDAQRTDKGMKHIHEKIEADKANCFSKDNQGTIWFNDRIFVPKDVEVCQQNFYEAHLSRYSIHLGSTKMYQDLKQHYWWTKMKIEIARCVASDTCRRVKAVHDGGLLRRRRSCKKKHLRKINTEATPKLPSRELRHSDTP
jgi:hypothetical protein